MVEYNGSLKSNDPSEGDIHNYSVELNGIGYEFEYDNNDSWVVMPNGDYVYDFMIESGTYDNRVEVIDTFSEVIELVNEFKNK